MSTFNISSLSRREEAPGSCVRTISERLSRLIQKVKDVVVRAMEGLITAIRSFCACPTRVVSHRVGVTVVSPIIPSAKRSSTQVTHQPVAILEIPAAISQSVTLNQEALPRIPQPFDAELLRHVVDHANPPVDLKDLAGRFAAAFRSTPDDQVLFNDPDPINKGAAWARIRVAYLGYINQYTGPNGTENAYNTLVANSISLYLRGLVLELKKPEIPLEKKQEMLCNLALAAGHCPPHRHEAAQSAYLTLSQQIETMENIVLGHFQRVKEDLLLGCYPLSIEPVATLNYIRLQAGEELGLDRNPVNIQDIYIGLHHAAFLDKKREQWHRGYHRDRPVTLHTTKREFIDMAETVYTPENFLKWMMHSLNQRIASDNPFQLEITRFIADAIQGHEGPEIGDAERDRLPEPYQDAYTYQLTPEGIRFLLCHFGLLTPKAPNGHLVRAAP